MNKKLLYVMLAVCGGIALRGPIKAVNGEQDEGFVEISGVENVSQEFLIRGKELVEAILQQECIQDYHSGDLVAVLAYICKVAKVKEYQPKEGSSEITLSIADPDQKLFSWVHKWARLAGKTQGAQIQPDQVSINITPERFGGLNTATIEKKALTQSTLITLSKASGSWSEMGRGMLGRATGYGTKTVARPIIKLTEQDLRSAAPAHAAAVVPALPTPRASRIPTKGGGELTSRMPGVQQLQQQLDASQKALKMCEQNKEKLIKAMEDVHAQYGKLREAEYSNLQSKLKNATLTPEDPGAFTEAEREELERLMEGFEKQEAQDTEEALEDLESEQVLRELEKDLD